MKTLKKFALIAVLLILTSGAFAQQQLNFVFTDSNPQTNDVYTITADLFYHGNYCLNICTNAPVYLNTSNLFSFAAPYVIKDNAYYIRVTLAKNGTQSIWWLWNSNPFNWLYWYNNNINVVGSI